MKEFFPSFITGFICTAVLFFICTFIVVGARTVFLAFKKRFSKVPEPVPKQKRKQPTSAKKTNKPINRFTSIEINPDEIDRIYVKKSS